MKLAVVVEGFAGVKVVVGARDGVDRVGAHGREEEEEEARQPVMAIGLAAASRGGPLVERKKILFVGALRKGGTPVEGDAHRVEGCEKGVTGDDDSIVEVNREKSWGSRGRVTEVASRPGNPSDGEPVGECKGEKGQRVP